MDEISIKQLIEAGAHLCDICDFCVICDKFQKGES